ncbi:MAG: hypothetical protein VBE63_20530 [Lamprobacter sp.]|uniref:hypothetical protein n=1 Tax=Lamprobacter sp. TaxID=3100796 RepID=UPI002B257AD3|nr:hypothetical protein [Lamprobacter sp.]MEA3642306.1 hypothetical protein [Lamprobacter sp.]
MNSPAIYARSADDILKTITRVFSKVPDDIPVKNTDDLLKRMGKAPSARQADGITAIGKKGDDVLDATRAAARRADVLKQLNKGLASNPALLRQVDQLDDAGREAALLLIKGGERLANTVPDVALRGKLIRAGGADLVAGAGKYGDEVITSALRLQTALDAGAVALPAGKRAITLADFTATVSKMGQGGIDFFNNVIQPNWKVWLGSGLFAWWVIDPEGFQDASGQLVEQGVNRIQQLAGEVAASAAKGAIEGSGEAVSNIGKKTWQGFQSQGLAGVIGILLLLSLGSLFFKRVRYYVFAPLRWLNRAP